MSAEGGSCADQATASSEAIRRLEARGGVYALLGRGFSFPDDNAVEYFQQPEGELADGAGVAGEFVRKVFDAARGQSLTALRKAYTDTFHPVSGPFPFEAEHKKFGDDFGKAQLMADVMGFYRAFGVEPEDERPDYIAAELEFMCYLAVKEAHALRSGAADKAKVCGDAAGKFFHEHVVTWTDSLLTAMRGGDAKELPAYYANMANLLEAFVKSEKEELA